MTTTFRASVMLVIFVGAPAAWIYLGPLPREAQQVVTRLISTATSRLRMAFDTVPVQQRKSAPRFDVPVSPQYNLLADKTASAGLRSDIEPVLEQLRRMGVAEYALEPWGMRGNLYRFRCTMPIGQSDDLTTQFEGVNEDPGVSVRQVLQEVIIWQHNRSG